MDTVDSPNPLEEEAINKFLVWASFEDEEDYFPGFEILIIIFYLDIL